MSLPTGTRLGPYEIVAPIGAGGMGEVYRARDTRLQRQVAIKVVPPAIAADPTALARFEREAQSVAALSHPNILALHDIGREGGTDGDITFAVMELLEGKTLREVLVEGPIPVRKGVEYGRQIADGLAAAHDRGIVHRDLKPENIFVTADGRVKLLDFGLALVQTPAPSSADTVLARVDTTPGTILGTIGYMAPEQVRGQAVDSRADIFSFGAVLYEMLGGKRAFGGATPADTMSAILNKDPEEFLPAAGGSHLGLDRIVRRALEKEPAQRFQSARDLGFALEAVTSGSGAASGIAQALAPARASRRNLLPIAVALAVGGVLGAAAWRSFAPRDAVAPAQVMRFTWPATEFQVGLEWVSVSPNGRTMAWGGNVSSAASQNLALWVRHLENPSAEIVKNVNDVRRGYFMSDNKTLLCLGLRDLFTIDLDTGRRTVIWTGTMESPKFGVRGAAVGPGDRIALGANNMISLLENGVTRVVAEPEAGQRGLGLPSWMPDGKHLLFSARMEDNSLTAFVMPIEGGARRALSLPQDITAPMAVGNDTVLYGQSGILWAQRLDPATLANSGPPLRIASDLSMDAASGFLSANVSPTGILVFRTASASPMQFEWVDRSGLVVGKVGGPGNYSNFDVSPNGDIAVTRREPFINGNSLWLIAAASGEAIQLNAFQGASYSDPAFSIDGSRLAVRRGGKIVVRTMQGATETTLRNWLGYPDSWSRDGRIIIAGRPTATDYGLWAVSLDDPSKDVAVVTGVALADEGKVSPDGKWVAYHAAQKATPDVFVTPFPSTGERLQISTSGGVQPRWSPDGNELYFLDLSGQLMSAAMPGGDPRKARAPQTLFRTELPASSAMDQFAVSADGKRFLIKRPLSTSSNESPVQVVLNWRTLLSGQER